MDKVIVKANPKCNNCLGSGVAALIFGPGETICPCVTEQLLIVVTPKDYSIPKIERYVPGTPTFVDSDGNIVLAPQNFVK